MRILLVGTCLGVGGAERVMVDLADAYSDRGHQVGIVSLRGNPELRPRSDAVEVFALDAERFWHGFRAARALARVIGAFRPDVVHAHLFHAILMTRLVRSFAHMPVLVTTTHSTRVGGLARRCAYRLTERLSDVNSTVSREAAQEFVRLRAAEPDSVRVVHNGISLRDFWREAQARREVVAELGLDPEGRILLAVGRLSEPKDYPNLLRAVAMLHGSGGRMQVLVAGEGPLRDELAALASELGVSRLVHWLGLRRDVRKLMSAADLFVLSSAWEGFPVVVGEAMACECIVVATDCGGVQEFLGDAGFLVPPRDPALLAAAMRRALALSPEQRSALGRAARARIEERFSLEASVDQWLRIYGNDPQVHAC
jgi:glycosyltransferase involved in cell wall biosynthesis